MTPPANANDPVEGPCGEDRCDWWPWAELHACVHCTTEFCESHIVPADHDCTEVGA